MKVKTLESHEQSTVEMDGASGAKMRMLIGPVDGAGNFHMRQFEVQPGGHTPHHSHDYEHEILVLGGSGTAKSEQGDRPIATGDVIFVAPNEKHQFVNPGPDRLSFICLVPAPHCCAR